MHRQAKAVSRRPLGQIERLSVRLRVLQDAQRTALGFDVVVVERQTERTMGEAVSDGSRAELQ